MCVVCFALFGSPKADITFPSASKPELIDIPSLARSPTAADLFNYKKSSFFFFSKVTKNQGIIHLI
jgi:hypothetical protein